MKCPVCGSNGKSAKYKDEFWGMWIDSESYWFCNNCDYGEEYIYGTEIVSFGHHVFRWDHNTYSEQIEETQKEIKKALKLHKPTFGLATCLEPHEEEVPF